MEAAVRAAADFPQLHVIALTVVTSLTDTDLPVTARCGQRDSGSGGGFI